MRASSRLGTAARIACVLILPALGLASPEARAENNYDYIAVELPIELPDPPRATSFPGMPQLSERMQYRVAVRRAFFAGDFDTVERALAAQRERAPLAGWSTESGGDELTHAIARNYLAGMDRCKQWVRARPTSYLAHWLCADVWMESAWSARSGEFANKVAPVRFELMRERLEESNRLLKIALTLDERPVEALVSFADNQYATKQIRSGIRLLARAEAIAPTYTRLHSVRVKYALPRWYGSFPEAQSMLKRALAAGIPEEYLLGLQDKIAAPVGDSASPRVKRDYWEKVVRERPTSDRLSSLAEIHWGQKDWKLMLPLTEKLVSMDPDYTYYRFMHAVALEGADETPRALAEYRLAAAAGSERATKWLIKSYINGWLGLTARDWKSLYALCSYGAALGVPVAANYLGAMYWDGSAGTGAQNFPVNPSQGLAWYLFAARGGAMDAQYDLGFLLFSGRVPAISKELGRTVGLFWLRRAAEQEHVRAIEKLREAGEPLSEPVRPSAPEKTLRTRSAGGIMELNRAPMQHLLGR